MQVGALVFQDYDLDSSFEVRDDVSVPLSTLAAEAAQRGTVGIAAAEEAPRVAELDRDGVEQERLAAGQAHREVALRSRRSRRSRLREVQRLVVNMSLRNGSIFDTMRTKAVPQGGEGSTPVWTHWPRASRLQKPKPTSIEDHRNPHPRGEVLEIVKRKSKNCRRLCH